MIAFIVIKDQSEIFESGSLLVAVVMVSSLLNASYFLPIVYAAFFKKEDMPPKHEHGEAPWPVVVALSFTALGTLFLFFFPDIPLGLAHALVGGL